MKSKKIFIILFLVSGFFVSGFGLIGVHDALQCKKWIKVRGHIIDATVGNVSTNLQPVSSDTSVPDIVYEYQYNGQVYFSSSIAYFAASDMSLQSSYYANNEVDVLKFLTQYPVGSDVDVFINPDNPEESVLDTSLQLPVFFPLICGILLIGVAIHFSIFGDRYFPAKSQALRGN